MNEASTVSLSIIAAVTASSLMAAISEFIQSKRRPLKHTAAPLVIFVYATKHEVTKATINSLRALPLDNIRIVAVAGQKDTAAQRKLRTTIRHYGDTRISTYTPQRPANRHAALIAAMRRQPRPSYFVILSSGDTLTPETYRRLKRLSGGELEKTRAHTKPPRRLALSLTGSVATCITSFINLVRRIVHPLWCGQSNLQSGALLAAPYPRTQAPQPLRPLPISEADENRPLSRLPNSTLAVLALGSLLLLGLSFSIYSQALSYHLVQPILLLWLVIGYGYIVAVAEAQHIAAPDKVRLMVIAPISGIVLPVGLAILFLSEGAHRLFKQLRTPIRASVHLGTSTRRALWHPFRAPSPTDDTSL